MQKNFFILLLVFCVFITLNCDKKNPAKPTDKTELTDGDFWMMNVPLPQPMFTHTCEVNGKIYALGGTKDPDSEDPEDLIKTVYEYDPSTKNWTSKGEKKIGRLAFSASAVNGKIYIFGGLKTCKGEALRYVEEYDPETGNCSVINYMPQARPRACFSTSVVNEKIYMIGGIKKCETGIPPYKIVDVYDPATNEWIENITEMPTPRYKLTTSVVNGKIYAIGGIYGWNPHDSIIYSTIEAYDPETNKWTTSLKGMSTARKELRSEVIDGKIYVFGGRESGNGLPLTEMYDPEADTCDTSKANMIIGRYYHTSSVVNGKIYAFGGATEQPQTGKTAGPAIKDSEDYTK